MSCPYFSKNTVSSYPCPCPCPCNIDGPISKSLGKLLALWTLHLKLNQLNGSTTLGSWVLLSYLEGVKILHIISWWTTCLKCILLKSQNERFLICLQTLLSWLSAPMGLLLNLILSTWVLVRSLHNFLLGYKHKNLN